MRDTTGRVLCPLFRKTCLEFSCDCFTALGCMIFWELGNEDEYRVAMKIALERQLEKVRERQGEWEDGCLDETGYC